MDIKIQVSPMMTKNVQKTKHFFIVHILLYRHGMHDV